MKQSFVKLIKKMVACSERHFFAIFRIATLKMKEKMMNKEEKLEIYRNALDKWGVEAQMTMVYEELGELETALARYERGRVASEDVITELADVTIMCEQMALLLGYDDYEKEIENKLERVVERLNK